MKKTTSSPALRISHKAYIRIMDQLITECSTLPSAIELIEAVHKYMYGTTLPKVSPTIAESFNMDGTALPKVSPNLSELLNKFAAMVDAAALRSAKARRAALARRNAKPEQPLISDQTATAIVEDTNADAPQESNKETAERTTPSIQNSKSQIQKSTSQIPNPSPTPIQNSKSQIQNSSLAPSTQNSKPQIPNPSPKPLAPKARFGLKIKHKRK